MMSTGSDSHDHDASLFGSKGPSSVAAATPERLPDDDDDSGRRRNTVIHLNHAGASPCAESVLHRCADHAALERRIGGYRAALVPAVRNEYRAVYRRVSDLIHAATADEEIALVESATVAWTRIFYSFAQYQQLRRCSSSSRRRSRRRRRRRVVLVSEAEYAANVVAACQWCRSMNRQQQQQQHDEMDWTVLAIPSKLRPDGTSTGKVNVDVLRDMLQGRYRYQNHPSRRRDNNDNDKDDADDDASSSSSPEGTQALLDPSTIAVVCVTHIPTGSGIVNPVNEIGRVIHEYNQGELLLQQQGNDNDDDKDDDDKDDNVTMMPAILYLVDACQSVGQRRVSVREMRCHAAVGTGRKFLRGPRGTGFLYVQSRVANRIWPHHVDHYGIPIVVVPNDDITTNDGSASASSAAASSLLSTPVDSFLQYRPVKGARRFEFWESNVANRLGFGVAVRLACECRDIWETEDDVGVDSGSGSCSGSGLTTTTTTIPGLARYLYRTLNDMDGVCLHHFPDSGIVTFWIPGVDSNIIAERLWQSSSPASAASSSYDNDKNNNDNDNDENYSFEVTVSPASSTPLDSIRTAVPDMVRVSISYTNSREELDHFCHKLRRIIITESTSAAARN